MYQTSIRNKKKHSLFQQNKEDYIIDINNESYAYVISMLGNCRVSLMTDSGEQSIGVIRGSLRKFNKRIIIEKGDIVVISKRDFQTGKVDIVHKFNSEQSKSLIKDNKISPIISNLYTHKSSIDDNKLVLNNKNDDSEYFVFDNISDNSSSDDDDEKFKNVNEKFKVVNLNNKGTIPRDSCSDDDYSDENYENECVLNILNILNSTNSTSNIVSKNNSEDSSDADIDFI